MTSMSPILCLRNGSVTGCCACAAPMNATGLVSPKATYEPAALSTRSRRDISAHCDACRQGMAQQSHSLNVAQLILVRHMRNGSVEPLPRAGVDCWFRAKQEDWGWPKAIGLRSQM